MMNVHATSPASEEVSNETVVIDEATIRRLEPALVGYARRRVGSADVAADLVQDTWIAALRNISSFAGRSSLRTWLVSILRRKIVDLYRRERHSVSFLEERHGDTWLPRMDGRIDDEAAVQEVGKALHHLPEKERQAITLVDVLDLEREEAARQMEVTRNHLRVLLHRGRLKLRAELEARDMAA